MIPIDRSNLIAPPTLLRRGPAHLEKKIRPAVQKGTLKSKSFDGDIYGHEDVKRALWETQSGKCCFCEQKYEWKSWTVEHFRPKTRAVSAQGRPRVGYWWLAYEIENLLFCCPNCNSFKRDNFPELATSTRLRVGWLPSDPRAKEKPALVDPGRDDPKKHLRWKWQEGRGYLPVAKTARGKATLGLLKLAERDALRELRYDHHVRVLKPVIDTHARAKKVGDAGLLRLLKAQAQKLTESGAPFAGMARAVFREHRLVP